MCIKMYRVSLFSYSCLLLVSFHIAAGRQTSLEDIEKDNLNSEIQSRTINVKPSPEQVAPSPTKYGFVPVKTVNNYVQQEPTDQYQFPQQYVTQPPQQYTQHQSQPQPQFQQYGNTYQNQLTINPSQNQQYSNPYYQYDNINYVSDNSIPQQSQPQHYQQYQQYQNYVPQYVYLQPHSASSNSIQSVVDPNGVQYIMYIPSYVQKGEESQNVGNVIYANDVQEQQLVPQHQQQIPTGQLEYQVQNEKNVEPTQYISQPRQNALSQYVPKRHPKSLLDSYIPSILQLQYYKDQLAQSEKGYSKLSAIASKA